MVQIIPHFRDAEAGDDAPALAYLENKVEFILDQPQAFWLCFAEAMDWDLHDDVAAAIVARRDCDIAVIAVLFWASDPAYAVQNPKTLDRSLVGQILRNLEAGWYKAGDLALPREVLVRPVMAYLRAIQSVGPFGVPHRLFGPFDGENAILDFPMDPQSVELLEQQSGDQGLDFRAAARENYWYGRGMLTTALELPEIAPDHATRFAGLDSLAYGQSVFGTPEEFVPAQKAVGDDLSDIAKVAPKRRLPYLFGLGVILLGLAAALLFSR